jgi:hypothetical protein
MSKSTPRILTNLIERSVGQQGGWKRLRYKIKSKVDLFFVDWIDGSLN